MSDLRQPIPKSLKFAIAIFMVVFFVLVANILYESLNNSSRPPTTVTNAIQVCIDSGDAVPQRDNCIAKICNPLPEDQRLTCYMTAQKENQNLGK
jgi:hypothetical protein